MESLAGHCALFFWGGDFRSSRLATAHVCKGTIAKKELAILDDMHHLPIITDLRSVI